MVLIRFRNQSKYFRISIFGLSISKSLKQEVTVLLPNARQQVWVSQVIEDVPCHSRCSTLKIHLCFMTISAEYSFEFAASSGIVEQFSNGKKIPKSKKRTNICMRELKQKYTENNI